MSEASTENVAVADANHPLKYMFHPTFWTSDRKKMSDWLMDVFHRKADWPKELMEGMPFDDSYDNDYALWTWISDVQFDAIQPDLHMLSKNMNLPLDRLSELGWYARDAEEIYQRCRKHNVRVYDQSGRLVTSEKLPSDTSLVADGIVLIWLDADDVGFSVEIGQVPYEMEHGPEAYALYPRHDPKWRVPELSADDPLGIIRSAQHTILTRDLERSLKGAVDICGGRIIHQGENKVLGTDSTYVYLAESVLEFAVPKQPGGILQEELDMERKSAIPQRQHDAYFSINFYVDDLDKARKHLASKGIALQYDSDELILTDPKDCLGMRWGFTSGLTPNDPRA